MRVWFSGRTKPSQGLDTGPIPVTRSNFIKIKFERGSPKAARS
jgi:hypothetical protein